MPDATAVQVDTQRTTPDVEAMQRRINEMHSDLAKAAERCTMPMRIMGGSAPHSA